MKDRPYGHITISSFNAIALTNKKIGHTMNPTSVGKGPMSRTIKFFACFAIFVASLPAQNSSSITGTVRDATGAVIPGANVVATSVEKGTSNSTKSNGEGDYLIGALSPGHYNVTITQTGFKQFKLAEAITLDVAQKAKVDAVLQVGEMATEVSVESTAVQVQTESPELSSVVTGKEISQIVLNGRNFAQLVTLVSRRKQSDRPG